MNWNVDRSVTSGLVELLADERQLHERRDARHLAEDRAQDLLLALGPRDVGVRRVEQVLADARVDHCALAAHVLRSLREAPPLPAVALGLRRQRAFELREDPLRNVDVMPPSASITSLNCAKSMMITWLICSPVYAEIVLIASGGPPAASPRSSSCRRRRGSARADRAGWRGRRSGDATGRCE